MPNDFNPASLTDRELLGTMPEAIRLAMADGADADTVSAGLEELLKGRKGDDEVAAVIKRAVANGKATASEPHRRPVRELLDAAEMRLSLAKTYGGGFLGDLLPALESQHRLRMSEEIARKEIDTALLAKLKAVGADIKGFEDRQTKALDTMAKMGATFEKLFEIVLKLNDFTTVLAQRLAALEGAADKQPVGKRICNIRRDENGDLIGGDVIPINLAPALPKDRRS